MKYFHFTIFVSRLYVCVHYAKHSKSLLKQVSGGILSYYKMTS